MSANLDRTVTGPASAPIQVKRTGCAKSAMRKGFNQGQKMRALIICAIIITASIGLTGCFHHSQAVTQEPLKLG